ncbi:hypothetical protein CC78DRAFT_544454 [Lojkania enalia]|uniref:VWA7 N-terminal domain-containing protein n=1 Tax=Lojkania enalia TaxID=147567 RepID=A0A9P4MZT0_9PLEO|nr:hypothetical protein CC78DRAFT_544454 [Didymosphaeria enalia]
MQRNIFVLVVVPYFILLATCKPFGTVNGILGQHNEHEMISRLAFQCPPGQNTDGICFEPISLGNLAGTHGVIPLTGDNGMVGSPDDIFPEGPEAHCDDADFLDAPGYPMTRDQATAQLQRCVDHLRMRFGQAVRGVARMLNSSDHIIEDQTELDDDEECDHNHRETTDNTNDKAKCVALEGFGRALHGIQDFYSHSNWADLANSNQPTSVQNPPGLGLPYTAPFLDLRLTGSISSQVPYNLSTGCYFLLDGPNGRSDCRNRITHYSMNKDHGWVYLNGTIVADADDVPRNEVPGNFVRAVTAAVEDSQRQWEHLRDEIRRVYGTAKGNRMICGLISDDPASICV